jgi:hypothetical protein
MQLAGCLSLALALACATATPAVWPDIRILWREFVALMAMRLQLAMRHPMFSRRYSSMIRSSAMRPVPSATPT